MKLTAVIERSDDGWYVGQIEELPSVISQGRTREELRINLVDAIELVFKTNRQETEKDYRNKKVIREQLVLA